MLVDLRGAAAQFRFEGRIVGAHRLPVVGQQLQAITIEAGIALGVVQRGQQRVETGLRGQAGKRRNGGIHRIDAGAAGHHQRCDSGTGSVMRMQRNRDGDLVLERPDEFFRRERLEQARHILDVEDVGAHPLQFLAEIDVVLERILVALGIEDVARVAHGGLQHAAVLEHRLHRRTQAGRPVERVEHPEDIDAVFRRKLHETVNHVVGIVGVTDRVGTAQQHLEKNIGDLPAQFLQAFPRAFVQEAHGDVEGGAAPALQRIEVAADVCRGVGNAQQIVAADAGRQERLVRVTHGGIANEQPLLLQHPVGQALGAAFQKDVAGSLGKRFTIADVRHLRLAQVLETQGFLDSRIAVDHSMPDEGEHLGGTVAARRDVEQLRMLIKKGRGADAVQEIGMVDNVAQETDVGLDAAHPELDEHPVHMGGCLTEVQAVGGNLHQQRIVVGRNPRAGIGVAGIQTHTRPGTGAVGFDGAEIGGEVVLRILGADTALNRVAAQGNIALLRNADFRIGEPVAFGDPDLDLHQIAPGDQLGHRMLHLDAGIGFDEVEVLILVQQELHRTRVDIVDRLRDLQGIFTQELALLRRKVEGRRDLDDLLVAALHRAVALEEVHHVAVLVAHDLDFHMLGPLNVLFQKDRRIAERRTRLRSRALQAFQKLLAVAHHPHATSAAAGAGLDDDGITALVGKDQRLLFGRHRFGRAGHDWHTDAGRHLAGRNLVAQAALDIRVGADKGNPCPFAGLGKLGVFRQKAVTGMNGVHTLLARQINDFVNAQIGFHRALAAPHLVGLIRLVAVQRDFILLRIDSQGVDAQRRAGAKDSYRYLAPVGCHDFFEFSNLHPLPLCKKLCHKPAIT